jgi:hypothetical protein
MPKNKRAHKPLMTIPLIAAARPCLRTSPIKLRMNANGGATKTHSPPRTVVGDPHPGWAIRNTKTTNGATNDKYKPQRARFAGLTGGRPALGSIIGGSLAINCFQSRSSAGLIFTSRAKPEIQPAFRILVHLLIARANMSASMAAVKRGVDWRSW